MRYPIIDKIGIEIPQKVVQIWQNNVNFMAKFVHVPIGLIMRVISPFIEVFRSSSTKGNTYKVGAREHLAGLYCEMVIKSKNRLLIPNALKDKNWDKNPDIKLGMISYLGYPIFWPDDDVFGTICVLDTKENHYNSDYEDLILLFKENIESNLSCIVEKYY